MDATYLEVTEFGEPKNVIQQKIKQIEPLKNDDILVRMVARPINPSDLIPIRGSYAHRTPLPYIPGYEGVGIVEAVGPLAPESLIGQRVLPLRGEGTWQQYVQTKADFAIQIPPTIDDITAAQLYINPVTAFVICREELNLQYDDFLIVNACGSAIGHIFAQLARIIGFQLIAVVRNDEYTESLYELGATAVINTTEEALLPAVERITSGKKAAAAIDSIGGSEGDELAFSVREGGIFLALGLLSGKQVDWPKITSEAKLLPRLFHLRNWNEQIPLSKWHETFQTIIQLIERGELHLNRRVIRYDFNEYRFAIQKAETTSHHEGKIFLTNSELFIASNERG